MFRTAAYIVLILLSIESHAQSPHLGFQGGLNISSMHFSPPASAFNSKVTVHNKSGLMLGTVLNVPLSKHIHLETGLTYDMKGLKLSGQSLELRYTYHYLDIPLYAQYVFKRAFMGAGPYVGTIISGKVKLISVDTNLTEKIPIGGNAKSDGIKRVDWGVNFKLGYELANHLRFTIQYGIGLANVEPAVNTSENHRLLTISIGYLIHQKRQ